MKDENPNQGGKKVLLLIDWDNVFLNLFKDLGPNEIRFEERIDGIRHWLESNAGKIFGGHGFVFAPEHLSSYYQEVCRDSGLKIIICPKEKSETGPKKDVVDENIIWFAELLADHPDLSWICLASGDSDYVPMLKRMKEKGKKIALAIPTLNSYSRLSEMASLADKVKNKKMILLLDSI